MVKKRITITFLLAMTAVALYCCYLLLRPFLEPLLAAIVIAIVFFPVHQKIQHALRNPNLAALLSTLVVVLLIIVPMVSVLLAVKGEVSSLVDIIREKTTASGGFDTFVTRLLEKPMQLIGRFVDLSNFDARAWLLERLQTVSAFLVAEGWMLVGGVTSFIVNAVIAIFTLFFLFREGRSMRRRAAAVLPLTAEQVEKLFGGVEDTIIGTVYGGLVVAAVQGFLTGLALWVFGVPSPVLWGVVAAFFALLPLVGTAAVWVPASIYLLASGHWIQAIILAAWGGLVVGTIDNFLRPYLIGGRVKMHTLLIFFAVFGGVSVFGFLGLFIGPVIVAVTIALLGMLRDEGRGWSEHWRDESHAAAPSGDASK